MESKQTIKNKIKKKEKQALKRTGAETRTTLPSQQPWYVDFYTVIVYPVLVLINSLSKYLLSIYYVPGTVLGTGDTKVSKSALAGVAQCTECRPENPSVSGSIPVRAHAWVVGQVPSRGHASSNRTLMFLSRSLSLPSPFSKNKINLKKKQK